ncbi:MAG: hypothetical protein DRP50_03075 [Thermotoga sp.]|nr:MAG: hypothetical protein DRP50_03075 [Thermotoga sp.]
MLDDIFSEKKTSKPIFDKKWKAVLFDVYTILRNHALDNISIRDAWYYSDRKYLKKHGIKTYEAYRAHIRRLKHYGYLSVVPNPERKHINYPIPMEYKLSKAGKNRLKNLEHNVSKGVSNILH